MNLWSVEHFQHIKIRFSSSIGEGESNSDEKSVEEVFNLCSTEQSFIHIVIACWKISTLNDDEVCFPSLSSIILAVQ